MINAEIRIGKFGRTNLGKILVFAYLVNAKGERYENKVILSDGKKILNEFYYFEKNEKIVKESYKLTGIIEVGDYVNGYKVLNVGNDYVDIDCDKPSYDSYIFDNQFKTIVTKEQFKNMEYKVGGNND